MPWSALPTELIVRILEALDPYEILNCRKTSRLLKSVVDDTAALQYRIALHSSGVVDGPPSRLSTSERLSLLRSYETSWKNLDWNTHTTLPVPEGSLWELYGNVWAHSRGKDAIFFVQIPSRLRDIPLRQWTIRFDFPLRDFGMDPSQDLLVAIEMATYASFRSRIRLLSLSTGEEHRLARNHPTLEHLPSVPRVRWMYSIRISGDYLGILFINDGGGGFDDDDDDDDDDNGNELVVWNWKTGVKNLTVTLIGMTSFIFLGDNFVLASASTSPPLDYDQPSLLLYSLDQTLARKTGIPNSHLLRFLFPIGRPTRGHSTISLTSDPSPIWPTVPDLRVPFHLSRDERTIALRRETPRSKTYVMPASALLRHIKDTEVGCDIPWESWSLATSVIPFQDRWSVYTCFVFGTRHILPNAAHRDDRRVMVVRDLCPRRYMRASEEEREESNALHQAMGTKEPYPRSIVKSVPLPRSFEDKTRIDLMISEDGIVAFEEDPITRKKLVHLLTF